MKVELNHKIYGQGDPLIILHGLFGSLDNWATIGRKLGEEYMVYLLDQRDHGKSPHTDEFSYDILSEDLKYFMDDNWVHQSFLVGHSMGGKTAMRFALEYGDMVEKLVVLDMAPRQYSNRHQQVFDAMDAVDFESMESRADAKNVLMEKLGGDQATTAFLLKNIKRLKEGGFSWKMNTKLLRKEYDNIIAPMPTDKTYDGPCLFVKGGNSAYITEEDNELITSLFPNSNTVTMDNVGHWLHAEKPVELMQLIKEFLQS
jgi:pimeloyl-ACP methyl ester carboxylesterase